MYFTHRFCYTSNNVKKKGFIFTKCKTKLVFYDLWQVKLFDLLKVPPESLLTTFLFLFESRSRKPFFTDSTLFHLDSTLFPSRNFFLLNNKVCFFREYFYYICCISFAIYKVPINFVYGKLHFTSRLQCYNLANRNHNT